MLADKEALIGAMATFTWYFGQDWLVETEFGNFHWKDPDYKGDNTMTLFNGSHIQFRDHVNVGMGRDKGLRSIEKVCGTEFTLVYPQE